MSSLEAALGRAQLERLDELVQARRRNALYYTERLRGSVEVPEQRDYAESVYWMYGIRVASEEVRDGLMRFLAQHDIETRTFFFPMCWQPIYKAAEPFPVAEDLGRRGLYLPSSSHLSDREKDTVIRFVLEYVDKHGGHALRKEGRNA